MLVKSSRLFVYLFLLNTLALSAQNWENLTPLKLGDYSLSGFVVNDSMAFVAGQQGVLLKTTDRGNSWRSIKNSK